MGKRTLTEEVEAMRMDVDQLGRVLAVHADTIKRQDKRITQLGRRVREMEKRMNKVDLMDSKLRNGIEGMKELIRKFKILAVERKYTDSLEEWLR